MATDRLRLREEVSGFGVNADAGAGAVGGGRKSTNGVTGACEQLIGCDCGLLDTRSATADFVPNSQLLLPI